MDCESIDDNDFNRTGNRWAFGKSVWNEPQTFRSALLPYWKSEPATKPQIQSYASFADEQLLKTLTLGPNLANLSCAVRSRSMSDADDWSTLHSTNMLRWQGLPQRSRHNLGVNSREALTNKAQVAQTI